jgi:hypothetical protein
MATAPKTVPQLGPDDDGRLLTAEEFAEADYAGPWKYERERGRLIVMPPDGPGHDDCSEPVRDLLGAYRIARPDVVEKVVSEAWVRVDAGTDRIGDIGVFLVGPRSAIPRPGRVPELMFEFVSPDRESRDRDYCEEAEGVSLAGGARVRRHRPDAASGDRLHGGSSRIPEAGPSPRRRLHQPALARAGDPLQRHLDGGWATSGRMGDRVLSTVLLTP